jgi:DNA polymerase III alpha subunit
MEYLRRHEYAYIQEYFDRIEEMRLISKRLWKLVEENSHNPILQKDLLSELCKSTIAVANFYQSIKELDQASATLKEESDARSASSQETIPTPHPEVESSEALKEEPEMISASSQETIPTPPPEVEISQQYIPKKIAKYTSEGKPVTVGN